MSYNYTLVLDGVPTHILEATDTLCSKHPLFAYMSILVAVYNVSIGKYEDMRLEGHILTKSTPEESKPFEEKKVLSVNGSDPMGIYEATDVLCTECSTIDYLNVLNNVRNVVKGNCSKYRTGGNVVSLSESIRD